MNLESLKEKVESLVSEEKTFTGIKKALSNEGLDYEDATKDSGYQHIRVFSDDGYVRIFRMDGMKNFKVRIMRKVNARYSGIPVFEPSGKKSF